MWEALSHCAWLQAQCENASAHWEIANTILWTIFAMHGASSTMRYNHFSNAQRVPSIARIFRDIEISVSALRTPRRALKQPAYYPKTGLIFPIDIRVDLT